MINLDILDKRISFMMPTSLFEDLRVYEIGYHNFKYIEPLTMQRVQDCYTLHFVLDGEGDLEVNDKTYHLTKSATFYLPPNIPFKYIPSSNNPWIYMWITLHGNKVKEYYNTLLFSIDEPIYYIQHFDFLESLAFDFFTKNRAQNISQEKMLAFFYEFASIISEERIPTIKNQISQFHYVEKMQNIILLNYTNVNFKIEKLSLLMNLSHSYMCYIFKKVTNLSAKQFLINVRNKKALTLLPIKEKTISEISFECGYSDPLYFSTMFKKHYKLSPTEFREKNLLH